MWRQKKGFRRIEPQSFGGKYLVVLCALCFPSILFAQDVSRIAAIVNDEIISAADLTERLNLTIFVANFQNTPETRRRLSRQVLRTLVDERIQMQEATRLGVRISDHEIQVELNRIEQTNDVKKGELDEFLSRRGVKITSLVTQIRAQSIWIKTLRRKMRRQISVGDEEIDEELQRLHSNNKLIQNRLAEILLTVSSTEHENEVKVAAERLVKQIRGGARFNVLARQFSNSASGASGGELGWVTQGQLDTALDSALKTLRPGQITEPVRTFAGYHILMLRDQRTPESVTKNTILDLSQLVISIPKDANAALVEAKVKIAANSRASLSNCTDLTTIAKSVGSPQSGTLGKIAIKDLPSDLQREVQDLSINEVSEPIVTPSAILLLMVCDRIEAKITLPTREQVQASLSLTKLDLLSRKYLRDLRRSAFVEYRL